MKSAFIVAVKAFASQVRSNYKEHIKKEYDKLFPAKQTSQKK